MWHNFFTHLPRLTRYTLGTKVDTLFIEILEMLLKAQYTRKENKLVVLNEVSSKVDDLKFFVTLLWEAKGINANKYTQLSQKLVSVGRMLGKWQTLFKKATPPA